LTQQKSSIGPLFVPFNYDGAKEEKLDEAHQLVAQSTHEAIQYGFPMYIGMGRIVQSGIVVRSSDRDPDLNTLEKALSDYRATSAQSLLSVFLSFLAEALSRCGKSEEAFATLAEALKLTETSLEVYWVKGELLLAQEGKQQKSKGKRQTAKITDLRFLAPGSQAEAEACFLKAIEIARQQEAKSLELRAVMSLVRLRQRQTTPYASRITHHATRTRLAEARDALSEVYHWFTEGFDTHDLQEAKALLDELATHSPSQRHSRRSQAELPRGEKRLRSCRD
jgi:tetratricopeptide (TPR) repeat protein